mmetsp:Transcript_16648/g.46625  ORF Transcript_16648/g.46625 Transcript_16648/m.46625 type:complete len:87 (+) Transcript_16648:1753-2013(+)
MQCGNSMQQQQSNGKSTHECIASTSIIVSSIYSYHQTTSSNYLESHASIESIHPCQQNGNRTTRRLTNCSRGRPGQSNKHERHFLE